MWAFAVSPYGLALEEPRFWRLTPREFDALKMVWAQRQAAWHNAHFHQDPAFDPDDFMNPGARTARKLQAKRDAREVAMLNKSLELIRAGDPTGLDPEYARAILGREN